MAFVHLHNHSFFSVLDASTSIQDMVDAAVAQHMHALALTDHAYMFGIPDFDLACRKYNDNAADMKQYKHDVECYEKQWDNKEPKADDPDAAPHDRCHAQWEKDKRIWDETHDIDRFVRKNLSFSLSLFLDVRQTSFLISVSKKERHKNAIT